MAFISPSPLRAFITPSLTRTISRRGPATLLWPQASLERTISTSIPAIKPGSPPTTLPRPTPVSPPSPGIPAANKPGNRDDFNFLCGSSVTFWRNLDLRTHSDNGNSVIYKNLRKVLGETLETARSNPKYIPYFVYHFGRSSFFAFQGIFGIVTAAMSGSIPRDRVANIASVGTLSVLVEAAYVFQQDLKHIKAGIYRMPWDASMGLRHRQMNPAYVFGQSAGFFKETVALMKKRQEQSTDLGVWLDGKIYPDYYKQTYHYQTDGWMSSRSADMYDCNTETLFIGRQDAMQRLTLLALSDYFNSVKSTKGKKVIELGAGTGRFATFVRDNWPHINYTVSDLSPFYLQKALENMNYWEKSRNKGATGSVQFLQAAAEDLPVEDGSIDVVFSVYLFHELPPLARRAVIDEAARVLKPGGMFVITDSIQLGDRPSNDPTLGNFGQMNEPWYVSYIAEDFGGLVTEGRKFVSDRKEVASVSKMLSFRRTSA